MTAIGRLRGVVLLALLLALAGCKKPKPTEAETDEGPSKQAIKKGLEKRIPILQRGDAGFDLQNIAKLYYADALLDMPPKKVEDLKGLDARTVQAIKDGDYVVVWGARSNTPGNAVIAYEKDVPTRGGMVATFGGSAVRMTPEEFKAAPKVAGH